MMSLARPRSAGTLPRCADGGKVCQEAQEDVKQTMRWDTEGSDISETKKCVQTAKERYHNVHSVQGGERVQAQELRQAEVRPDG